MLKTNSKQAKENLKAVMVRLCSGWDADPQTAEEASFILAHDYIEANKGPTGKIYLGKCKSYQEGFEEWGRGLTNSIFDQLFYFGHARELVAEVLEETPEEANKYTEDEAGSLFCTLIWTMAESQKPFINYIKPFNRLFLM